MMALAATFQAASAKMVWFRRLRVALPAVRLSAPGNEVGP
jgi:hypothetical protein